jgi:ubiquinone biosynthesis monooxygenase Coq6
MTASAILEEIKFRESAHQINEYSVLSSTGVISQGVPAVDAESYPPLVRSIQPNTVASFPLRFSHADEYIGQGERGNRTVLVGDAAHTVHPLAGQGLNMGLADAEALSQCIYNAVSVGGDVGA